MKIETAEFILSANRQAQLVRDGRPEIAFAGRSNVGKSSLMNRLLRRRGLARTGSTPGRTRAVNYFLINRRFYFVDLPGYGFARASWSERQRWADLMNRYFRQAGERTLLVQLIDGKVGATDLDQQGVEYFRGLGLCPLVAATKIDKVSRSRRAASLTTIRSRLEMTEDEQIVPFSAVTGEGVQQLWKGILVFLDSDLEKPRRAGMS